MKLPENFAVPTFILEAVLSAPEELLAPSDSVNSKARLKDLLLSIHNPDVLYVICELVRNYTRADQMVNDQSFSGIHDIFTQQQVIGERRGLRQFFATLDEIHQQLVESATSI